MESEDLRAAEFRRKVAAAIDTVRRVLDTSRRPELADEVQHTYTDKFGLVDQVTASWVAVQLQWLRQLGVSSDLIELAKSWSARKKKSVSLRFEARETCVFDHSEKHKVEPPSPRTVVTGLRGLFRATAYQVSYVMEHHWNFAVSYRLVLYAGASPDSTKYSRVLHPGSAAPAAPEAAEATDADRRSISCVVVTTGPVSDSSLALDPPHPEVTERPPVDLCLDWLLKCLDRHGEPLPFAVNRKNPECYTPRRNPDIEAAEDYASELDRFLAAVSEYFRGRLIPIGTAPPNRAADYSAVTDAELFAPMLPLLERRAAAAAGTGTAVEPSVLLDGDTVHQLIDEHARALTAKLNSFAELYGDAGGAQSGAVDGGGSKSKNVAARPRATPLFIGQPEAVLLTLMLHARDAMEQYLASLDFVEDMLRRQIVAAVGKVVSPSDFAEYMAYHARKKIREEFLPRPFCHAVRRPEHYPEGVVSLDVISTTGAGLNSPICTFSRRTRGTTVRFQLNAATEVDMAGDMFVHGCIMHRFGDDGDPSNTLELNARTGQFSSYILMLGKMNGPTLFAPKYAMIVRNKDAMRIPLSLSVIPSRKEFQDAIQSLSPEQQQFAQAFRGMQLEGTLFAVATVQIKPQLELLLRLPPDSLTKEIQLTERLMDLFIKYQIPSDLLTYQGKDKSKPEKKVRQVVSNADSVHAVIDDARQQIIREAEEKAAAERAAAHALQLRLQASFDEDDDEQEERIYVERKSEVMKKKGARMMPKRRMQREKESKRSDKLERAMKDSAPDDGVEMCLSMAVPEDICFDGDLRFEAGEGGGGGGGGVDNNCDRSLMDAKCKMAEVLNQPTTEVVAAAADDGAIMDVEANVGEAPNDAEVEKAEVEAAKAPADDGEALACTDIPALLDQRFDELDGRCPVRPTTIDVGAQWRRQFQRSIIADPLAESVEVDGQQRLRNDAFDLLDALSRSGTLPLAETSLHVVIVATHCFERSLMDTLVFDNINPIDKVEASSMVLASTILGRPASDILLPQ
jgi:hypothetical protein